MEREPNLVISSASQRIIEDGEHEHVQNVRALKIGSTKLTAPFKPWPKGI